MARASNPRRLIRALAAAGVLLLLVAGPAGAQDEGSSPDENDQVVLTGQLLIEADRRPRTGDQGGGDGVRSAIHRPLAVP